jgi:hypothetical protein
MKKTMKNSIRLAKQVIAVLILMVINPSMMFAQDVANDIQELFDDQINPILNTVVIIGLAISAVWIGISFFQGKKESMQKLAWVFGGLIVIKFLVKIGEAMLSN